MPSSGHNVREYVAVYGCVRALTTAVVAVTVAVGDTGRPSACQAGSRIRVADTARRRSTRSAGIRRSMLTQLGEWARLGFFTRTGSGTYKLNTPPAETPLTNPPDP
jgi:hypothetical protein